VSRTERIRQDSATSHYAINAFCAANSALVTYCVLCQVLADWIVFIANNNEKTEGRHLESFVKSDVHTRFIPNGLRRDVGAVVVALSALSQEYGSGINFVMPHSLARYPAIESLVPWAMLAAGLLLIPKVVLFSRYASIMPCAGSTYVWLTRAAGPYIGFLTAFLWFVGICGAIGFLAYASATFLAGALHAANLPNEWLLTPSGHLLVGLLAIWVLTGIHITGVKRYGYIVYAAGVLVIVAALIVILTGFFADAQHVVGTLSSLSNTKLEPLPSHPTASAFISTLALFMFAYGGLTAATSLGGETINPKIAMPRGIIAGWASALILYTLVAFSLFNAVPWWAAIKLAHGPYSYLLTAPGLVGLLQPKAVAVFLNGIIALVVLKTIAPQLLDASRYLYAWSRDGIVGFGLGTVNERGVPAVALLLTAVIGSIFLADAVFAGWAIGVIVRAASVAVSFSVLGLGTLLLSWWPAWSAQRSFSKEVTQGKIVKLASVAAILIGLMLISFVIYKPGTPVYFQPWFQIVIAMLVAFVVLGLAIARQRSKAAFLQRFHSHPAE
jgi:basic amino acid/polyamine antiporter, APA family